MTSKERILNRLQGKPVDKIPNMNMIMQFAARFINVPYDLMCLDYRYMVEAKIKCCEAFGIDLLANDSDAYRETFDYGSVVTFPYDSLPVLKKKIIKEYSDLKKLQRFRVEDSVRMLDSVRAVELFSKEAGDEYAITGWCESAFAEACTLRGMMDMMTDLIDEPEFVKELLEICCEQSIMCAVAQINAGADIISLGDAAASTIGPMLYREFAFPYEKKLVEEIHRHGALAKLHICGDITKLVPFSKLTGADILDVDWMVDFKYANDECSGYCSVNGNMNPVAVVADSSPAKIISAVMNCIEMGNNTSIISAGCEIPIYTPLENMRAIDEGIREYSQ